MNPDYVGHKCMERLIEALKREIQQQQTDFMLTDDHIENKVQTMLINSYQNIVDDLCLPTNGLPSDEDE